VNDPGSHPAARGQRNVGWWALALLLGVYLLLAVGSSRQKSVTVDELGHLPSGVYFLLTGDARYAALNPPLLNGLSALPVPFLGLAREIEAPPPSENVFSFWSTGYYCMESHRADYRRIFGAARMVPILVVAALGVLLFVWGRRLAPDAPDLAGLLAAGFVCLSPNVLAHARLIGTDTGTAFFVTLAIFCLWLMLQSPRARTAVLFGAALGLAQLTMFYALLLYPASLGIALAWHLLTPKPRPRARGSLLCLAAAMAISLVVVNSGYLWREVGSSLSSQPLGSPALQVWQETPLGGLPLPVPGAYVRAFDGQLVEVASSIPSFLFGRSFTGGRWDYYLLLLAVKTPIALFVAFGLGVIVSLSGSMLPRREAVLLLTYPLLLFILLSVSPGRQLGVRALLSAAPSLWLFASAGVGRSWPRRWPAVAACAALLGTLVSSAVAYPDYLSYFSVFAGGSEQGYRYASEANVDIGQDLVQLEAYLEAEGSSPVQLLYFGSVDPEIYGIDYVIPEERIDPGLLAVSVSLYQMGYPMYDRGRLRRVGPVEVRGLGEPVANIGGSIHVFRAGSRSGDEPLP
jgi:hypothetical protein